MASLTHHDESSWLSCFDCSDKNSESSGNNTAYMTVPIKQKSLQTGDEMKQTEAYLAAEFNKLTVQERAKAMDDIHCVGEELNETPEMIEQSLREFDHLVQKMKTPTYEMAVNQNKAFVEDPSFWLRFLRCNMHDVNRSVRQMMEFLKHKATYFGEDNVAREITLDDLNDADMSLLLSGLYHIQDGRDRKGRVVLYITTELLGRCKLGNLIHVIYYIWNNILIPIPDSQTKGVVMILYDVTKPGEKFVMPQYNFITYTSVMLSFPLRYSAMHVCLKTDLGNLSLYNALVKGSLCILPEYARARVRLHYGTDIEIHYYLRSHGISTQTCPVDLSGNLRMDILNSWFERHCAEIGAGKRHGNDFSGYRSLQLQTLAPEVVCDPRLALDRKRPLPQDVLLGRGWKMQNHEGNIHFRQFVEGYRQAYDNTPRQQRRDFAGNVTRLLRGRGVIFWKKTEDGEWVEGTFEEAEKKVGDLFRSMRRKLP